MIKPSGNDDKVVLGINDDTVSTESFRVINFFRQTFKPAFLVCPPHKSVRFICFRRFDSHLYPLSGYQLLVFPFTIPCKQQPEPSHIKCINKKPSTKMASATHRLDHYTINVNERVIVAEPTPRYRCTNRVHYVFP